MSYYLDIDVDAVPDQDFGENPLPYQIEQARSYLNNAYGLWSMLDPHKAATLRKLLDSELVPAPGQVLRVTREKIEQLVALLEGIERAGVGKITDPQDYFWVLPEQVEYVQRHIPTLCDSNRGTDKPALFVLNELSEILYLRDFFEGALRLGVDVLVD